MRSITRGLAHVHSSRAAPAAGALALKRLQGMSTGAPVLCIGGGNS